MNRQVAPVAPRRRCGCRRRLDRSRDRRGQLSPLGRQRVGGGLPDGLRTRRQERSHRATGGFREAADVNEQMLANSMCINSAKHPEKLIELIMRQEGLESRPQPRLPRVHE
jgi:hypothetical protein